MLFSLLFPFTDLLLASQRVDVLHLLSFHVFPAFISKRRREKTVLRLILKNVSAKFLKISLISLRLSEILQSQLSHQHSQQKLNLRVLLVR